MRAEAEEALTMMLDVEDNDLDVLKLCELFRLDIRSDTATLNGLDMDQIRQVHQSAKDLEENLSTKGVFLVADREVLEDNDDHKTWIKCVQTDYVAANHVPTNPRYGGQRYF